MKIKTVWLATLLSKDDIQKCIKMTHAPKESQSALTARMNTLLQKNRQVYDLAFQRSSINNCLLSLHQFKILNSISREYMVSTKWKKIENNVYWEYTDIESKKCLNRQTISFCFSNTRKFIVDAFLLPAQTAVERKKYPGKR